VRAATPSLLGALVLALLGCDAARAPFAAGAQAEAEGKLDDAIARYDDVCARAGTSALCARAAVRADRLRFRRALAAIDEKRFAVAKRELDAISVSKDAATHDAATALAAAPDLVQGAAWDEVSALADKRAALPRIEALASAHVLVSADAEAWLAKSRPALLLEDVKAACGPTPPKPPEPTDGGAPAEAASCSELGRKLSLLHPESPETAEATRLVDAEYRRMYPALKRSEALVQKEHAAGALEQRITDCMDAIGPSIDPIGGHVWMVREQCEDRVGKPDPEGYSTLSSGWNAVLEQIRDPAIAARLKKQREGEAPPGWPPPARQKK
jgi:hypothetical protein